MALAAVLTNFVSNSAARRNRHADCRHNGRQLGITPEPFVLAILFGANLSYATPMAYQTNMLMMSVAGYSLQGLRARRPAAGADDAGDAVLAAGSALRAVGNSVSPAAPTRLWSPLAAWSLRR